MSVSPKRIVYWSDPLFKLFGFRRRPSAPDLARIKRVLVVRPDEIGDAVMTTSFLRELRQNLPDAFIALIVKSGVDDLFTHCPYVNQVLTYRWDIDGRFSKTRRVLEILRLCITQLWKRRFDLAVYPRWDVDYYDASLLVYLSGAPRRVGYSENVVPWKKENNAGYDHFFSEVMNDSVLKHEVLHNVDMIRFLGGQVQSDALELWLTPEAQRWAREALPLPAQTGPFVALVMGARQAAKRWPFGAFGELAALLSHAYKVTLVLLGSREDQDLGVLRGPVIDLRGKTSLLQAAAVLKPCALYIGNDTGLMHIAAAVGTPVVELCCHPQTGSSLAWPWPERFHPWSGAYKVLRPKGPRAPCQDGCIAAESHCIADVSVAEVFEAAEIFLRKAGVTPALPRT